MITSITFATGATQHNSLRRCFLSSVWGALLGLMLLGIGQNCYGQVAPVKPNDAQWHLRYELFQWLFEKRGLTTLTRIEDAIRKPESSIIIFTGQLESVTAATWWELEKFVKRGGNVLIATDQACQLYGFGRVRSGPVLSWDKKRQYQGYADCLKIDSLDPANPVANGIGTIISNRSGWLQRPTAANINSENDFSWDPIATLPESVEPKISRSQLLIAWCGNAQAESGFAIVSADASFFTNNMLWHGDNGLLARQIADALCSEGKTQLVFAVDGIPVSSFTSRGQNSERNASNNLPSDLPEVEPDLPTLLRFANLAIQKIEESNIVNEALMKQPRSIHFERYYQWIWGVLAAIIISLIVYGLIGRKNWIPPLFKSRKMRSLLEMQSANQHLLNRNSYAAALLARDFCRKWTGKDAMSDWSLSMQEIELPGAGDAKLPLNPIEKSELKKIFTLAIYGSKDLFSDEQLKSLGTTIRELLHKSNRVPSTSF